jgi:predicted RNase H-like nuclease
MFIAGVDGCKAGWIAVFNNKGKYSYEIFRVFSDLMGKNTSLKRMLIGHSNWFKLRRLS